MRYEFLTAIFSVLLSLETGTIIFLIRNKRKNKSEKVYTDKIDKCINNKNEGIEIQKYVYSLSDLDINYIGWEKINE